MLARAGNMEEADMQTAIARGGGHKVLTRFLAAAALVAVYCLGTVGIVMSTSATPAFARGRGGGGGGRGGGGMRGGRGGFRGGRGFRGRGFRGRGRGFGGVWWGGYYDGCWWSYRWQRWVCPYY